MYGDLSLAVSEECWRPVEPSWSGGIYRRRLQAAPPDNQDRTSTGDWETFAAEIIIRDTVALLKELCL